VTFANACAPSRPLPHDRERGAATLPWPREVAVHPPVAPMLAAPADRLPTGPGWVYEPKWNGWLY